MGMEKVRDFQINVQLKKMLTERGIDTSKLNISTMGGTVYLRGSIEFIHASDSKEDSFHDWKAKRLKFLHNLETDIKKLRGVRYVRFQLTDWEKDGDKWVERKY